MNAKKGEKSEKKKKCEEEKEEDSSRGWNVSMLYLISRWQS